MNRATRPHDRLRRDRTRRGVALIVVLWTIVVLATVTAAASSAARGSADVAFALRASSVSRAMAESGIVASSARIDRLLSTRMQDTLAREAFLQSLGTNTGAAFDADTLGDGVFSTTIVDVSARLDVHAAGREGWYLLLEQFTNDAEARAAADRIDAHIRGLQPPIGSAESREQDADRARDSLVASLLGRGSAAAGGGSRRTFETLDQLLEVDGVSDELLLRVSPYLTVDGDGNVNRRAAPPQVIAAASGSLVDRPSRILIISRGWMRGGAITREIEAVYDVAADGLRLVRWREQER